MMLKTLQMWVFGLPYALYWTQIQKVNDRNFQIWWDEAARPVVWN